MAQAETINTPTIAAGRGGAWAFVISAAVILGSLPLTWFTLDRPIRDEKGHIPLVRRWIADPNSISISNFPEPKGIAVFAAARAWGKAFGTSCPALRSMIVAASIATFGAWWGLCRMWGVRRAFAAGIVLLVAPYFLVYTQLLYTEVPALLLAMLGLICAHKAGLTGRWTYVILGAALLGLLLWVRQTFVIVPVAIVLCSFMFAKHRAKVAAVGVLGLLGIVPMLILWGGTVPPGVEYRFAGPGLYWDSLAFAMAALGAIGWAGLFVGRPTRGQWLVMAAMILLAAALFWKAWPDYRSVDRMGLLQKALISLPGPAWLPGGVLFACGLVGAAVAGRMCWLAAFAPEQWVRLAAMLVVLGLAICLVGTPIFYDRYLILPLLMVLLIASQRLSRPAAWGVIAVFAAVAILHVAYITRHTDTPDSPTSLFASPQTAWTGDSPGQ